ncbi:hypothetical protein D3C84_808930 [compost metagenome]
MNHAAGLLDRGGQPQCQLQGVEVPAFGVVQTGLVTLAGHPFGQLGALDEAQTVMPPFVAGFVLPFGQEADPAWHHGSP